MRGVSWVEGEGRSCYTMLDKGGNHSKDDVAKVGPL